MQFPDEQTLIARGKYHTLSKERRIQLERVQGICTSLITTTQAALRDCEAMPPANSAHVALIEKCVENLQDAREKIVGLAAEMIEMKPRAWPQ